MTAPKRDWLSGRTRLGDGGGRWRRSKSRTCRSPSATFVRWRASPSPWRRVRPSRCWGPTEPARRPRWRSSRAISVPTAGGRRCSASIPQRAAPSFDNESGSSCRRPAWTRTCRSARWSCDTRSSTAGAATSLRSCTWSGSTRRRTRAAQSLSGGQKRRLDLALGLVGDPELLFLDEPTTGFDPSARRTAWETVENLKDLGKTILLTTHYMDEAQRLADRIVVIAAGRIAADGPPESIGGRERAAALITFRLPAGIDRRRAPGVRGGPPRRRGRHRGLRADEGSPRADGMGARPGRRAGGPERCPTLTRGRLSGADRAKRPPNRSPNRSWRTHEHAERRRPPGEVEPEDLLAQPGRGRLHLRLSAPVPRRLHRHQRQRHGSM